MSRSDLQPRRGIGIVGLLVVLALIAVMIGLLVPAVQKVREAAARAQCQNNLRQLAVALHNAHGAVGRIPPAMGSFPAKSKSYGPCVFHLLPYLEQDNLYKQSSTGVNSYYVWHNGTYSHPVKVFLCPSDASAPVNNKYMHRLATCNYAANWQALGTKGAALPASFPDGTSNTIVFTERYQMCKGMPCTWGYPGLYYFAPLFTFYSHGKFQSLPRPTECNPALPQSVHAAGIPVALADGSVRMVADTISPQTWWHACTPAGGEVLGEDW
jgi:type II secretory pathway pseudopilin PulG